MHSRYGINKMIKYSFIALLTLLIFSCSYAPKKIEKNPPPVWVLSYADGEEITGFSGSTVGVGYSEPTFYEEDAWRIASKNARAVVARSYSGKIRSLLFENMEGEETQLEVLTKQKTNVILKNSRIVDVWIDRKGLMGKENSAYALCVVPKNISSNSYRSEAESERLLKLGAPLWLITADTSTDVLRSIGFSQVAFFEADQKSEALKNAVEEMRRIIEIRVTEILVLYENLNYGWIKSASEEIITSDITATITDKTKEINYWIDAGGILGCAGCSYLQVELQPGVADVSNLVFESDKEPTGEDKQLLDKIIDTVFKYEISQNVQTK
ncbi:MAG: hypothetical protein IIB94_08870 [Candidatus Marinimicrobia bacterium]|nr:hypothetical protein [Candidatus Neomarinimicrobiota bacterium]